jgi:hypothetical protein
MKRLFLAIAALVVLALPAAASAAPHSPTGEYAEFNDCPLSRATLDACLFSKTTSGIVTIGSKAVPVVNPVILQGGLEWPETETVFSSNLQFFGAEDGKTLPASPQPVPGGLLGITAPTWWPQFLRDLFNETINNGFTGITSTVELAAPASSVKLNVLNMLAGNGVALKLPVKVKLSNPFLGSNCYIGSNSNPIIWNLTTGTTAPPAPNKPISGNPGTASENASGTIITDSGNKLVDNSFSAPGASGCGGILFSWAVDPFVNSISGLPAPAGTNTVILEGSTKLGEPAAIRASEP